MIITDTCGTAERQLKVMFMLLVLYFLRLYLERKPSYEQKALQLKILRGVRWYPLYVLLRVEQESFLTRTSYTITDGVFITQCCVSVSKVLFFPNDSA